VGNDDGGRRKDKVARRMIGMRFSIDEKANRQRRKLFDRGQYGSGVRRVMAAVNKNDSFLGQNNSTIGIQFLSDIDIDAVFKLLNFGPRSCASMDRTSRREMIAAKTNAGFAFIHPSFCM